ncbi:hypothetical protein PIB30_078866 [Stylosanthes scabra]|uniref:Uncharacterized protein n=1 Tax=Stylosanthes scabra TaxID=79078 RepID=A0ABU6RR95_9FABA|nr:hypothetical protein [Stylosanthes scabra]
MTTYFTNDARTGHSLWKGWVLQRTSTAEDGCALMIVVGCSPTSVHRTPSLEPFTAGVDYTQRKQEEGDEKMKKKKSIEGVEILQVLGLDLVNHVWAKSGTWSKHGLGVVSL